MQRKRVFLATHACLFFSFIFIFWGKLDGNWVNKIANVVDVVVVMLVPSLSLSYSFSPFGQFILSINK